LGYRWYIQVCTSMISIAFYIIHAIVASKLVPVVCCYVRVKILAKKFIFQALINKAAVLRVNLYPQAIIFNLEITLIPLC
ncbi:hypothetical protein T09_2560, partial [Trichinella sp. T9]